MLKIYCIESSEYISVYSNNTCRIISGEIYYGIKMKTINSTEYVTYDFETAEYIGNFNTNLFGPYELWISLQRDLKIDEILN